MAATLFRRIAEQLGPECQSLIDVTLQHRASVKVVARFTSGPPPITNVAVKRPLLPIFLRDERQHECSAAFSGIVWDLAYRQGKNSDFVLHVAIVREQDYFLNDGMIAMRNFRDDGSEQTRSLLIQVGSLTTRAALAASPEGTGAGSLEIFFVRAPARQRLLF